MKKLNQAIDRFCILHPNFGIPNLMLYVVIGNVVLGLLSNFSNGNFLSFFSYTLSGLLHGQVWRLVTFVLIPESTSPFYLLITCYFYYWIGSTLERQWGTAKFTTYYLSGMLLTVLGASIVSLITGYSIPRLRCKLCQLCHVHGLRAPLSRCAGAAVFRLPHPHEVARVY